MDDYTSSKFDPERFASALCSQDATFDDIVAEIDKHKSMLASNDNQLKANVFRHYATFISTSQQVSHLEKELQEVDDLLQNQANTINDLSDVLESGIVPGFGVEQEQERQLSDIAGLDRAHHLVGGDIIHQGELVIEQIGMQDVSMAAHAFLVPQCLMIARIDDEGGLQLHALEPCADLEVDDLLDTEDFENAFRVQGNDSYVFSLSAAMEKRTWLRLLRRAADATKLDEVAEEADTDVREDVLEPWLLAVPDELDVAIAQRGFMDAVELIAKTQHALEGNSSHASIEVLSHVHVRVEKLAAALSSELGRASLMRSEIRNNVLMMLRIGKEDLARTCYLSNWSHRISHDVRSLKVEGSTQIFVQKLASTFFNALCTASQEFDDLFDSEAKSRFGSWAYNEIGHLGDIFLRQVVTPSNNDISAIAACLDLLVPHFQKLRELGMDLEFLFWQLIEPGLQDTLEKAGRQWVSVVAHALVEEHWVPVDFAGRQQRQSYVDTMKDSGVEHPEDYLNGMSTVLFQVSQDIAVDSSKFVQGAVSLLTYTTMPLLIKWVTQVFLLTTRRLAKAFVEQPNADVETFETNVGFVIDVVLPACIKTIEDKWGGSVSTFAQLLQQVKAHWKSEVAKGQLISDM